MKSWTQGPPWGLNGTPVFIQKAVGGDEAQRGRGVNDTRDQALPHWGLWIRPEFPGVNQLGSCKPLGALVSPLTAPGPGRLQVGLWVRTLNVGAKHVVRKGDIRAMLFAHSDLEQAVSLLGTSASSIKQTGPLLPASQRPGED